MAVLLPMTTTILFTFIGVSYSGNLYAFIRLVLMRNSLAEYTPIGLSPGMWRNLGSSAPLPIKTASKPTSKNSEIVCSLPIIASSLIFTPRFFT